MTLPRRAPCNAKQAKAFANQEVAHLKRELTKQAERDEVNEGRRRKTPIKISELLKSKSGGKRLNDAASSVLFGWLENHMENPYPTKLEKLKLCAESGITNVQLRNWFTNIRKRHFRPTLQKGRAPRSALDLAIQQQRGKVTLMETHNRKKGSNSNSNSKASMTPSI